MIAALAAAAAALAGCGPTDCAYYGSAVAGQRCVVVGPATVGAGP